MGKIVEKAKIAERGYLGCLAPFLEIESEFRSLAERIEVLEDKREEKKPVPTDKDGKPEGGLKRWDVISYISRMDDKTKILGQLNSAPNSQIGKRGRHG